MSKNIIIKKCDVCYKPFDKKEDMEVHYLSQSGDNPCRQPSLKSNGRNIDNATHNEKDKKRYTSDFCHKSFAKRDEVEGHYLTHTGEKPCQPSINSNSCNIDWDHANKEKKSYTCDVCHKLFVRREDMERHYLTHTGEKHCQPSVNSNSCNMEWEHANKEKKSYTCDVCHKLFVRREDMERHYLTHTGEKHCQPSVNSNSCNIEWEHANKEKKSYTCDVCHKPFVRREDMERHYLTHTGEKHCQPSVNSNSCNMEWEHANKEKKSYTCDVCHKLFVRREDMERHYLTHTGEKHCQPSVNSNSCNMEWEHANKEKKSYTCDVCHKPFVRREDMERHYLTHTGEKPYRCDFCHKSYVRVTILKHHILSHIGEPSNSCKRCGREFMLASHLQRHMVFHTDPKPHKCPSCGKGFQTPAGVSKHMSVHTGAKTFVKCDICDKKFSCKANIFRHKIAVHLKKEIKKEEIGADNEQSSVFIDSEKGNSVDNKDNISNKLPTLPFVCQICGKAYTIRAYLKRHMIIHSVDNPLTCKLCQKQFIYQSNLTEHMLLHSSETRHTCKVCNKQFKAACALRNHMNTHTAETLYKCKICFKQYTVEGSLRSHMEWKHPEKSLTCKICNQNFVNKASLKSHMISHSTDRPFKCELCPKSFKRKSCIDDHMKRHNGLKLYNCHACNKSFVTQSNVNNHMLTHSDLKTYSCTICDKSYKSKWHLREHMHVHTNTKPHACDQCNMSFRLQGSLRRHKMRHDGIMPFKCETCGKDFRYKPNLREHQYVHTGEPMPFRCQVTGCNKTFFTKSKLDKHVSTHSDIPLYECYLCPKKFKQKNYFRYHMQKHLGEETAVHGCDLCGRRFSRAFILKEHVKTHVR